MSSPHSQLGTPLQVCVPVPTSTERSGRRYHTTSILTTTRAANALGCGWNERFSTGRDVAAGIGMPGSNLCVVVPEMRPYLAYLPSGSLSRPRRDLIFCLHPDPSYSLKVPHEHECDTLPFYTHQRGRHCHRTRKSEQLDSR